MTPQEFAQTFGPLANDVSQQTGLDPALVLGQAAQETGWGNHYVGGNLWGISPTDPASGQQEVARYPTVESGAQAYVDLIKRRYAAAGQAQGIDAQAQALASLGYNKNPGYAAAIARNARQAQSYLGGTQVAADQSSAPSSADLLKQMQGLRAPAPASAPTAAATDAPSSDDLLKQMQAMGGKGAQPQQEQQIAAAPPTAQPTLPPGTPSWLAPDPSRQYGEIVPVSRDIKTGELHYPSLPNILRQPLIGLTTAFGPGLAPGGGVQISPGTNTLSLAPETAAAANLLGARSSPAAGTGRAIALQAEAPLSSEFRAAPIGEAEGRVGATLAPGQAAPTGISAPPIAPPPQTSADAKILASSLYRAADNAGGTLTPQFTNKLIDYAANKAPQTVEGVATAGKNAVTGLVDRWQALKDQPLSLRGVQEMDEGLSSLIDQEIQPNGSPTKVGAQLQDIQRTFRSMIDNAGPGDTTESTAGFDALSNARRAWSQARKMDDIERIQNRAMGTQNPDTSFKNQINNLINSARSRGYSPDEINALKQAASLGATGKILHYLGSGLIPIIVGSTGAAAHGLTGGGLIGGLVGGLSEGLGALGGSSLARYLASNLQESRFNRAMTTLGQRVPQPYNPLRAPVPAVTAPSQRPVLLPGMAGPAWQTTNQQPP